VERHGDDRWLVTRRCVSRLLIARPLSDALAAASACPLNRPALLRSVRVAVIKAPMAQCSSDATGKVPLSASSPPGLGTAASPQRAVDQSMKPVLFEIFGELWHVEARLGEGVSASVYQVSSGRAATSTSTAAAAVKEFQAGGQGGDYGYQKERSVLEDIQGRKNIGNYCRSALVFFLFASRSIQHLTQIDPCQIDPEVGLI